jgi:hypothetical protein
MRARDRYYLQLCLADEHGKQLGSNVSTWFRQPLNSRYAALK